MGGDGEGGAIRVLVVDDHALFRHGLGDVLARQPDIEVVGEAADGDEAIRAAATLGPDVVLMDVRMPGTGGVEAARHIRAAQPTVRIVMLTVSEDPRDLFDAVHAGATGYLLKEVSAEAVAEAVRTVHRGHGSVAPPMVAKLLAEFRARGESDGAAQRDARLTERELGVLRLVARGMSNREIAASLEIAENTVKNHVRSILEKLRLRSRMEAALWAMREQVFERE